MISSSYVRFCAAFSQQLAAGSDAPKDEGRCASGFDEAEKGQTKRSFRDAKRNRFAGHP
jgi:hypothetical protein